MALRLLAFIHRRLLRPGCGGGRRRGTSEMQKEKWNGGSEAHLDTATRVRHKNNTGVRPSSGAAARETRRAGELSAHPKNSWLAAAGDGRTPPVAVSRCAQGAGATVKPEEIGRREGTQEKRRQASALQSFARGRWCRAATPGRRSAPSLPKEAENSVLHPLRRGGLFGFAFWREARPQ